MITAYDRIAESSYTVTRITWFIRGDWNDTFTPVTASVRLDLDTKAYRVTLEGPSESRPLQGEKAVFRGGSFSDLASFDRTDNLDSLVHDLLVATIQGHGLSA